MGLPLYIIDAFTGQPFSGNPAAVCLLSSSQDADWMQAVAREMNHSETAFLVKEPKSYRLRWFTPTVEVDLCGHATLASAHFLWETGMLGRNDTAYFETRSGLLTASRSGEWIEMDFPAEVVLPAQPPPQLAKSLGITPIFAGRNRMDWLLEVETQEQVGGIKPDFELLAQAPTRGVIVTARSSSSGYDFVSRFFAPRAGVMEDPVTGSAHCALGPYWREKLGKDQLIARQLSARGGVVRVSTAQDRVLIGGRAVTVLRAELLIERLVAGV